MKNEARFYKSSFSDTRGLFSRCVEIAFENDRVLVRHSQHKQPVIEYTHDEWAAFVLGVKHSEFDVPR